MLALTDEQKAMLAPLAQDEGFRELCLGYLEARRTSERARSYGGDVVSADATVAMWQHLIMERLSRALIETVIASVGVSL